MVIIDWCFGWYSNMWKRHFSVPRALRMSALFGNDLGGHWHLLTSTAKQVMTLSLIWEEIEARLPADARSNYATLQTNKYFGPLPSYRYNCIRWCIHLKECRFLNYGVEIKCPLNKLCLIIWLKFGTCCKTSRYVTPRHNVYILMSCNTLHFYVFH